MIFWTTQTVADLPWRVGERPPDGWLTPGELGWLSSLKHEQRRLDWLLGRWTAKRLIQAVLWGRGACTVPLDRIEILPSKDGAPEVNMLCAPRDAESLTLSISHSHGRAVCAVAMGDGLPLGVDVERVAAHGESFACDFLSEAELARVNATPPFVRARLVTAIWSSKEAALKAARLGWMGGTFAVQCLPGGNGGEEWAAVALQWRGKLEGMSGVRGWWRVRGAFVLAITGPAGAPLEELRI